MWRLRASAVAARRALPALLPSGVIPHVPVTLTARRLLHHHRGAMAAASNGGGKSSTSAPASNGTSNSNSSSLAAESSEEVFEQEVGANPMDASYMHPSGGGAVPAGGFSRIVASSADMTPEEFAAAEAEEGQTTTVSIDRSGLLGVHHTPEERLEDQSHKSKWTPMVDELRSQIKIRGALSVSDWMFQCLQNQQHGYYTSRHASSVIGGKPQSAATAATAAAAADGPAATGASPTDVGGDFITSPELGQIFGEMIGVWVLQIWEKLGKPSKFQLLELGPGKGTLMQDVLRTTSHWPDFMRGVTVHLCETSPQMRDEQVRALRVKNVVREMDLDQRIVRENKDKKDRELARVALKRAAQEAAKSGQPLTDAQKALLMQAAASAATPLPSASPASSAAAEDLAIGSPDLLMRCAIALPLAPPEGSMSAAPKEGEEEDFGYILYADDPPERAAEVERLRAAARATRAALPASVPVHWHGKVGQVPTDQGPLIVLAHEFFDALPVYQFVLTERGWCEKLVDTDEGRGPHHLRFVLSAQPTLASRTFMPADRFPAQDGRIGDAVELSAAGLACMEDLSRRLSAAGGAALVIDYGTNHPNANTLQAVQKHAFKHALEEPGQVDLTTLVDFKSLRATVKRTNTLVSTPPLKVLPLVTQSHFLRNMHIASRLEALVESALARDLMTEAQVGTLIDNATRLVEPDANKGGMGQHFKVMCVVSKELQNEPIVPFDITDALMVEEDRQYELGRAQARSGSVGASAGATQKTYGRATASGGAGLLDVERQQPPQLPYADPPPRAAAEAAASAAAAASKKTSGTGSTGSSSSSSTAAAAGSEHLFSSPPAPKKPPPPPSATSKRREAARQAAEELARARHAKQQAEAEAAAAAEKK